MDLILPVKKPAETESADDAHPLANGDTAEGIREAVAELSIEGARYLSYVYVHILTKAIQKHLLLDDLHLGDVLIASRNAGYAIDRKTGVLRQGDFKVEAA